MSGCLVKIMAERILRFVDSGALGAQCDGEGCDRLVSWFQPAGQWAREAGVTTGERAVGQDAMGVIKDGLAGG